MTGRPTIETAWTAEPFVPASRSLRTLQRAVQDCHGCPLYADTTQAVFGEGSRNAPIVLVGEQPGDQEDRQGHPWLDAELRAVGGRAVEDLRSARRLALADA